MTTDNPSVPQLLTPAELAKMLQVSQDKLYEMRRAGTGPTFCVIGRDIRYRRGDVARWLDAAAKAKADA